MKALIDIEIQLIKNKLKNIERKYIYLVMLLFVLMFALLGYIVYSVLNTLPDLTQNILEKYVFFFVGYFCLIFMPVEVYKTFVENKEFDILFLAPIPLRVCFIWNYLKKVILPLLIGSILFTMFIPLMINHGILVFNYYVTYILLVTTIYSGYIFLEMLLYAFLGSNLYKGIITIVGLEEVILFFILMNITNGQTKWMEIINFTEIIHSNSVCFFVIWTSLVVCLVIISYHIFKIAYYLKGCCNRTNKNSALKIGVMEKIKFLYYLAKDEKVFIRDIDRLKYVIVTCVIYIFSTFIDAQDVGTVSVFIAVLSFVVVIIFQLSFENIMSEKKKYDILVLSGIDFSDFVLHKTKFTVCNTILATILYGICLFIKNGLNLIEGMQIFAVIVPVTIFVSFFVNQDCSAIFVVLQSDKMFLDKAKQIVSKGFAMVMKTAGILGLYICLYFIKMPIEFTVVYWLLFLVCILCICWRECKKEKMKGLYIID